MYTPIVQNLSLAWQQFFMWKFKLKFPSVQKLSKKHERERERERERIV